MLFSKATKFWDGMRVLIVKFKCKLERKVGWGKGNHMPIPTR